MIEQTTGTIAIDQERANDLVVNAARATVAQVAPHELEIFETLAVGWRDREHVGRRRWRTPSSSVGFGIDTTLITDLALQTAEAAASEVLVLAAVTAGSWFRRRFKDKHPTPDAPPAGVDVTSEVPDAQLPGHSSVESRLTADQIGNIRDACRRHGDTLGLPRDVADLLASALVGELQSPPATR